MSEPYSARARASVSMLFTIALFNVCISFYHFLSILYGLFGRHLHLVFISRYSNFFFRKCPPPRHTVRVFACPCLCNLLQLPAVRIGACTIYLAGCDDTKSGQPTHLLHWHHMYLSAMHQNAPKCCDDPVNLANRSSCHPPASLPGTF